MTKQEIFDKVLTHMRQQDCLSMSANGFSCLYKSTDGCKCAIGILIPDDEYKDEFNNLSIEIVVIQCPTLLDVYKEHGMRFISEVQTCLHDIIKNFPDIPFQDSLKRQAAKFAESWGLTYEGS